MHLQKMFCPIVCNKIVVLEYGKTKASYQTKAEMEANKKKKARKENIWTADANSDVSYCQLNDSDDSDDSDETQNVYKQFNIHFKSVRMVFI